MTRHAGVLMAAALAVSAAGCSETAGPGAAGQVAIAFNAGAAPNSAGSSVHNGSLVLTGTNGTLQLDELHVIVDRFELKRVDDDGCIPLDRSCEKFIAPPMLLDLPLDGDGVIAVRQQVEADTYRRLRFDIEDLDDDDDNTVRGQQVRELRQAIRARFPDWPRDASMLVVGSFTPAGGAAQPFRVYFDAEIEIELRLNPPVTVAEGGTFTVELNPALLFRTESGALRNLALLDFERSGRLHELRAEVRSCFGRVEFRQPWP